MARTLSSAGAGAIFPAGTAAFVKRRLSEIAGLALLAAAGFLLAALASYAPTDPSLNSASGLPVRNLMGFAGAVAADMALQLFGAAAAVPVLVFVVWGWRLIRKQDVSRAWLRAIVVIAAMALLAIAASATKAPASWPLMTGLGGVVGTVALERMSSFAAEFTPYIDANAIGLAGLVLGLPALVGAIGFSLNDGRAVVRGAGSAVAMIRLGWRRSRAAAAGIAASVPAGSGSWLKSLKSGRLGVAIGRDESSPRLEPSLGRRADDADEAPASREPRLKAPARTGLVAPPAKAKVSKRADSARQGKLDLSPGEYQFPPLDLLDAPPDRKATAALNEDALEQNAKLLASVLEDFGVKGEIVKVRPGPVVTLYELEPAPGTKTSRVIGLADDIARSMSAVSVRVAVVPGRNVIGIELPNVRREMVYLRDLLASDAIERSGAKLPLALGKEIGGAPVVVDLARMPHLLIAGTTGSGKSVAMNTMVLSLIYNLTPEECRFIMIDPKMLELSVYEGIPHLLCPVVTEAGKAVIALKWVVREMENRYRAMSQLGVRNIAGYNGRLAEARRKGESLTRRVQTGFDEAGDPIFEDQPLATDPLPFIVVVVDEMADLMLVAGKDIEAAVQRLAQMARAAGIHLIMATQRPSVDVITGTIKANFPTRISFQVTSKIDSRTILGEQGAEQLLGQGDMLYMAGGGRISRVHGPFVSDEEVEGVVRFLKNQGEPVYIEAITEEDDEPAFLLPGGGGSGSDELYDQAVALVARERKASTSFIQRHLQIGYNRAARIIERMEAEGVISQANRVGRREVLVGDHSG